MSVTARTGGGGMKAKRPTYCDHCYELGRVACYGCNLRGVKMPIAAVVADYIVSVRAGRASASSVFAVLLVLQLVATLAGLVIGAVIRLW